MAIPKTPRKRAAASKRAEEEGAPETVVDTNLSETGPVDDIAEDAVAKDPVIILDEPETVEDAAPEATNDAPDVSVEDAVVLENTPTPEPEPEPMIQDPVTTAPAAVAAAPQVVKSGPGFVPLVLGGVVAAGLGFALARYVVPEGWPVPGSGPLQTQLNQQADEIKGLRAELQALPKDDSAKTVLEELGTVRATAEAALEAAKAAAANPPSAAAGEDFTPRIAALEERLSALEARPADGAGADPAVVSQLTADIEALRSGLAAQKAAAEALVQEAEATRADAAAQAQSVLLKAALTKVEAAVQSGAPFAEPLTLLADSGLDVPAVLSDNAENGLPTLTALAETFAEPARAALEESLRGNMGDSWSERIGSFLRSQTGARSLTPKEGDDPDAILSRANAAVFAGDLQTALTEIAALPEAAQTALSGWVTQAKLRLDAQAATVALATALSER